MTHGELVEVGSKYMSSPEGLACASVITEQRIAKGIFHRGQIPDVLGWRAGRTTCKIEVKVSRNDSRAELSKGWHNGSMDVGSYRYILSPINVQVHVPEGYGHLVYDIENEHVLEVTEAYECKQKDIAHEMALFASACATSQRQVKEKSSGFNHKKKMILAEAEANGGTLPIAKAAKLVDSSVKIVAKNMDGYIVEQFGARYITTNKETE